MDREMPLRTADVYGIQKDLPLNYVTRDSADGRLLDSLTRGKHLVIHGSSKQGKSSLRKHCLEDNDYIQVHCSNKWDVGDLNAAILKAAGYETSLSTEKTVSGKSKVVASLKVAASIPGFGLVGGQLGSEVEGGQGGKTTSQRLELDADDVNDIIRALREINFTKFIVLEDFHYLKVDTQKDFSVALKAYHEESDILFIVVGVWLEEGRLVVYNGDLTGRLISINADQWTAEELTEVIEVGEKHLNVEFTPAFKTSLIAGCFESVYIVQEVCYKACVVNGVNNRQEVVKHIGEGLDVNGIIASVVNEQSARYNSFLNQFALGFQTTELEMYKWILFAVLTAPVADLEAGLRLRDVRNAIQAKHPVGNKLNPASVTQALQAVAALQVKKDITPIILDYDETNLTLRVVDRSFLIWLDNQDISELLSDLGVPGSEGVAV